MLTGHRLHTLVPVFSAFSRSPQYWNSFNSFSSKVSDTCHVLAREQNLAIFRQVFQKFLFHQQQFQNDILEHDLLKKEKEKATEERMSSWFGRLEKYFTSASEVGVFPGFLDPLRLLLTSFLHSLFIQNSNSMSTLVLSLPISQNMPSKVKHINRSSTLFFTHFGLLSHRYARFADYVFSALCFIMLYFSCRRVFHLLLTRTFQLPSTVREMAAKEAETLRGHLYDAVKDFQKQNEVALKQHSSMVGTFSLLQTLMGFQADD